MNEYLSRLLGMIDVKEEGNNVIITGLPSDDITADIYRYWRTNKLATHMFSFQGKSKIILPKFFALEFLYMLDELRKVNTGRTSARTLNNIRKELLEHTWLSRIEKSNTPAFLNRSKLSLFVRAPLKHQREFLDAYEDITPRYDLNGYVVAMGVGTGKTLASLYLAECLEADCVVMLPPSRAVSTVWVPTLKTEYKTPNDVWVASEGKPLPAKPPRYSIFHYESFQYLVECAKTYRGKRVVVILDESHNLNELSAERTQLMLKFIETVNPVSVLWCSATPIKALGSEMIAMLRSFDPLFTPDVEQRFRSIFGKNSSKANDIISNRMGVVSYKVEVVKSKPSFQDLPIEIPNPTPFTLDQLRDDMLRFIKERMNYYKSNFKHYEDIYNRALGIHRSGLRTKEQEKDFKDYVEYISMIRKGYDPATMVDMAYYCNKYELGKIIPSLPQQMRAIFKDCRSVVKYLDLKVRGECLGRIVGRRRTEAVLATIPHARIPDIVRGAQKKTVIFTSYVEAVQMAEQICLKSGLKPLVVYGDTNKNLKAITDQFFNDPDANPLIATYQSLSTAVPLTVASTMIALNLPFREHDYQQAVGRIDRINQDTPTEVINIILNTGKMENITGRTVDILRWSKEQVDAIMGNKAGYTVELAMESYGYNNVTENIYGLNMPYFTRLPRAA